MTPDLSLISLDAPPPPVCLPPNFPDDIEKPYFLYGDHVRWKRLSDADKIDTGIIIGCCYLFAHHQNQWAWKYLVFLDLDSYSRRFCTADAAWEQDLEPID